MFGKKKQSFEGVTVYTAFHHINGLPIAENLLCEVFSYPDRIEFKAGTTNIKLAREKITDMYLKFDTEIQNQAVSSVGGANKVCIDRIMGHKSKGTGERVYTHKNIEELKLNIELITN